MAKKRENILDSQKTLAILNGRSMEAMGSLRYAKSCGCGLVDSGKEPANKPNSKPE